MFAVARLPPGAFSFSRRMVVRDPCTWMSASGWGLTGSQVVTPGVDVLLVSHHPIRTAGVHGGKFPWWQNALFYIYPFARYRLYRSPQDLSSGRNKEMRDIVMQAMSAEHTDPIIHASGHEHGLQVFDAYAATEPAEGVPPSALYLVSGAGSKAGSIGKSGDTLFKHGALGFMTLDFMTGDRILLRIIEPGIARTTDGTAEGSAPVFFHWIRE